MSQGEIWKLLRRGRVIARLEVVEAAFPWLHATVVRESGFDEVAPLFAEELRQHENLAEVETPEWTAACEAIRRETALVRPDGQNVAEYLLHIDGASAWWRWSDDPFQGR
ncbi:MAG: hypothetical protein ACTHJM_06900 [Marmoricola sp.]